MSTASNRTCIKIALPVLLGTVALAGQNQDLTWYTVDGGGVVLSTGGIYELSGTIGQPDAGSVPLTGGDYSLNGGFWYASTTSGGACCYLGECTQVASAAGCQPFVCNVITNELPECSGPCGTTCLGDANGSGFVTVADRGFVSANVGNDRFAAICQFDLDGNGVVSVADRGFVSANVGLCTALPDYQNGSGLNHGQPDSRFSVAAFMGTGTSCETIMCP